MAVRMQINLTARSRQMYWQYRGAMCNVMYGTVGYHTGQYEDYVLLQCESVLFGGQVQTFRRNVILP
jgi:hypothetical protein